MKIDSYDIKEFPFSCLIKSQLNKELSLLHHELTHEKILVNVDLEDSSFFFFYKNFIKKHIKAYLKHNRVVASKKPSLAISLPGQKTYHDFSHPVVSNFNSVFMPLNHWFDSNTITIQDKNISIGYGDFIFLPSVCHTTGFNGINNTNNSSIGLTFYFLSYTNYKNSEIDNEYYIGKKLILL